VHRRSSCGIHDNSNFISIGFKIAILRIGKVFTPKSNPIATPLSPFGWTYNVAVFPAGIDEIE
jgi:hypothetical protein